MVGHFIPAGKFFCPRCFDRTGFVVAEDASPDDPDCALECYVCGYVYDRIVEEFDPDTGEILTPPRSRPAISRDQREEARRELRKEFRTSVIRDGVRLENFGKVRLDEH